ncbi:MAG: DUF1064 domain-containing protein [Candidatus Doudnabacteria bacterium]|nr:DUF1064 domain-containing protein [Candidatus Doudnabacteria bacterium]
MSYREVYQNQTRTKNKYGAKGQTYDGLWYHSKKEAKYAEELDWLLKAKKIQSWERQVKIDITVNGKHICNYYCDFKVINKDGDVEFHEVKGFATSEWQLKWKLFHAIIDEISPGAALIVIK